MISLEVLQALAISYVRQPHNAAKEDWSAYLQRHNIDTSSLSVQECLSVGRMLNSLGEAIAIPVNAAFWSTRSQPAVDEKRTKAKAAGIGALEAIRPGIEGLNTSSNINLRDLLPDQIFRELNRAGVSIHSMTEAVGLMIQLAQVNQG